MTPRGDPETMDEARTMAMIRPQACFRLSSLSKNAGWQAVHEGRIPHRRLGPKTIRIPVREWLESIGEKS